MTSKIAPIVLALLAGCASAAAPEPEGRSSQPQASATSCAQDTARLRALLRRPHDPARLEEAKQLCSDAIPALGVIARDPRGFGVERLRAIELLGRSPGAAPALLSELALSDAELASVRRAALVALGRSARGEVVLSTATRALSDIDPHVRAAAASVLGRVDTTAVRTSLERAREHEREPFVREAIERALERRATSE